MTSPSPTAEKPTDPLTPRQRQVVDLFLGGMTYKEVAAECGISPETVNPVLKAVRKKLRGDGISRGALRQALGIPEPARAPVPDITPGDA